MKYWQLAEILKDEVELFKKHLSGIDLIEKGRYPVNINIIMNALIESKKKYCRDSINYLRLYPVTDQLQLNYQITVKEVFTIHEAYLKFGSDPIVEVLDYGSYNLNVNTR